MAKTNRYTLTIDNRELSTLLGALRTLQVLTPQERSSARVVAPNYAISEILSDHGHFKPLTLGEVDELCERINFAPEAKPTFKLPHAQQTAKIIDRIRLLPANLLGTPGELAYSLAHDAAQMLEAHQYALKRYRGATAAKSTPTKRARKTAGAKRVSTTKKGR